VEREANKYGTEGIGRVLEPVFLFISRGSQDCRLARAAVLEKHPTKCTRLDIRASWRKRGGPVSAEERNGAQNSGDMYQLQAPISVGPVSPYLPVGRASSVA